MTTTMRRGRAVLAVALATRVVQPANYAPAQWQVASPMEPLLRSQRVSRAASVVIPQVATPGVVAVVTTVAAVRHQQMRVHRVDRAIPHPLLSVR